MNIKQDLNVRTSAAETDIFQFPSTGWVDRRNSLLITPIMERHFFFIKVLTVYFLLVSESFLTSTPLPPPPPPSTHPSSLTVVMGWDTNILQVSPLTVCHLYPNASSVIYSCAALVSQSWSGFKSWQAWLFFATAQVVSWSAMIYFACNSYPSTTNSLLPYKNYLVSQLSVKYILYSIADIG